MGQLLQKPDITYLAEEAAHWLDLRMWKRSSPVSPRDVPSTVTSCWQIALAPQHEV